MKWRYYRTGLYTEKKRSHWLQQWPIRKGLGDKKGELSLVEDVIWTNLLNSPLVDRSNVPTRSKLHLQPMRTRLSYLLNPFLLATAVTNEISSFLYINQFGSISTSFWRYPLKSVRRKALGWISYFTPSSSSVPPNVFSNLFFWPLLAN